MADLAYEHEHRGATFVVTMTGAGAYSCSEFTDPADPGLSYGHGASFGTWRDEEACVSAMGRVIDQHLDRRWRRPLLDEAGVPHGA